jgi:hypothetical protein
MTPRPARTPEAVPGVAVRVLRWCFRSRRTGRLTVVQWPNIALWIFIVASLTVRVTHPSGLAHAVLRVVVVASLLVWALDEVTRGVNPFRRLLGAVVAAATIASLAAG